jgi:hypothetical protein
VHTPFPVGGDRIERIERIPARDPQPLRAAVPAAPDSASTSVARPIPTTPPPTAQTPPPVQPPAIQVTRNELPPPTIPAEHGPAVTTLRPPPAPATPPAPGIKAYGGPKSGVVNWSGRIEKNGTVALDGKLPGVPVMINIDTKEFAIVEAPSPANGWNRVVIRSKNKRHTVIAVGWAVL